MLTSHSAFPGPFTSKPPDFDQMQVNRRRAACTTHLEDAALSLVGLEQRPVLHVPDVQRLVEGAAGQIPANLTSAMRQPQAGSAHSEAAAVVPSAAGADGQAQVSSSERCAEAVPEFVIRCFTLEFPGMLSVRCTIEHKTLAKVLTSVQAKQRTGRWG